MKTPANLATGETRVCPHCKATILKSAAACPICHHFLRFEALKTSYQAQQAMQPLRVEGTVRQTSGKICEYSVVIAIHNDRGEEITRQVVAVGALSPSEVRKFTVSVEVYEGAC